MNQFDLKGRRAVVTGAAQGFGRAIAERLLASGARVALWDMDAEETARTAHALGAIDRARFTQTVDVSEHGRGRRRHRRRPSRRSAASTSWSRTPASPGPTHKTWEYPPGRMAARHRSRSAERVLLLPRGDPGHARAALRPHRHDLVGRRQRRQRRTPPPTAPPRPA